MGCQLLAGKAKPDAIPPKRIASGLPEERVDPLGIVIVLA
jgi:hypothetical protein